MALRAEIMGLLAAGMLGHSLLAVNARGTDRPANIVRAEALRVLQHAEPWNSGAWAAWPVPGSPEAAAHVRQVRRLEEELARHDHADVAALHRRIARLAADAEDPWEPALITGRAEPLRALETFLRQPSAVTEAEATARIVHAERFAEIIEGVGIVLAAGAATGRAPSVEEVDEILLRARKWDQTRLAEGLRVLVLSEDGRFGERVARSLELRLRTRTSVLIAEAVAEYARRLRDEVRPYALASPGWSGHEAGRRALARAVEESLGTSVDPYAFAAQARHEFTRLSGEILLSLTDASLREWEGWSVAEVSPPREAGAWTIEAALAALRAGMEADRDHSPEALLIAARAEAFAAEGRIFEFVRTRSGVPLVVHIGAPLALRAGDSLRGEAASWILPPETPPLLLPMLAKELGPTGRLLALDRAPDPSDPLAIAFAEGFGLYALRSLTDPDCAMSQVLRLLRELESTRGWMAEMLLHVEGRAVEDVRLLLEAHRPPSGRSANVLVADALDRPGRMAAARRFDLHLEHLRRTAREALGPALIERDFHEAILAGGPADPETLTRRAEAFIQRQPVGLAFD